MGSNGGPYQNNNVDFILDLVGVCVMTGWNVVYRLGTKLLDLLEKSVIFSGVITIGIIGAICYLAVTGRPIPETLTNAAMVIVGFFFGARSSKAAADERSDVRKGSAPHVTYVEKAESVADC